MARFAGQGPILFGGDTALVDSTKQFPLGTRGRDESGNVYVYLKGGTNGAAGKFVTYDENYAITLLAGNAVGPVAVLMSALAATTDFGWGQIYGVNTIASTDTTAADKQLYIDGTAGRADDASATGDLIVGAVSVAADATNVCSVWLNYPHVTDVLG
jgi:hypothetical protein